MEALSSSKRLAFGIVVLVLVGAVALTMFDLRLASSQTVTLVAKRSEDAIPIDDPADDVWEKGSPIQVPLSGQSTVPPHGGGEGTVTAKALHDGEKLYVRVEWSDATKDESTSRQNEFTDAAAVQFPVTHGESVPAFCMGNPDAPVNIWQWKAAWQAARGSVLDVQQAYPNAVVDYYPFEDEPEFYPAAASGNIVARADRTTNADNLLAGSFGTLTAAEEQIVSGQGQWEDGTWSVVFSRDLTAGDEYAQFAEGDSTNVAFAVWNGANAERDGMKSVSQFMTLEVSSEIATGAGGGLSGEEIGLFVTVGLVVVAGLAAAGGYFLYAQRQKV